MYTLLSLLNREGYFVINVAECRKFYWSKMVFNLEEVFRVIYMLLECEVLSPSHYKVAAFVRRYWRFSHNEKGTPSVSCFLTQMTSLVLSGV